jgi:acyl-[acyl carrier protein]--UDP-N-acetylglucosamine O-acyltransferase
MKYRGEPTALHIGDRNTIREFCTFNRGTAQDVGVTRVGDDNWVMAYVHLAHDVQVGTTRSWPTTPRWPGTCTWATGPSSAA